jgi:hypothetical protein
MRKMFGITGEEEEQPAKRSAIGIELASGSNKDLRMRLHSQSNIIAMAINIIKTW